MVVCCKRYVIWLYFICYPSECGIVFLQHSVIILVLLPDIRGGFLLMHVSLFLLWLQTASWRAVDETLPHTLFILPLSSSHSPVSMAMSSDPGYMGPELDPDSSSESSSPTPLSAKMAGITITDPSTNGLRNGAGHKRAPPQRPHLSGRKMSLQERGTYLSAGGGAERISHISPRAARRPTIESKRVSISDAQVRLSRVCPLLHLKRNTSFLWLIMWECIAKSWDKSQIIAVVQNLAGH